jgi:hypothetical protein
MELQEKTAKIAYQAFRNIDFINNYKSKFLKYNFSIDDVMTKMDKKENIKILKELGYEFKIFSPGQHYNYDENFGNIKLTLSSKISGGIINNYIYIYINNKKINSNFYEENLAFIYRHLKNDNNAITNAFKFRNFNDFRNAMSDIISIYEDFKTEFLKLMKEHDLLGEDYE